ncbi:hypothetical protein AD006_23800 [Pseudonocardia sp. EC080610-09]|uniref:PE domain-containing protein n=1 Tax=unclassified Pseudonocardia TaxID=2619320 RepID=UPI0006CB5DD8|nr:MULTISPECIES: PE domain-containing protein [unclassified Pseudonocardia]ALE74162.1 hypothetical protein FRP1_16150 [Pseudonocardia sp. EC080625-04]ALL77576.1 hypothetical protein AD006_23800 [Pseudonocardia sp. EC080610-09]ALL80492.1 hypothetical protein AD017_03390 [Pseudonocardia sp. EC080619-01]
MSMTPEQQRSIDELVAQINVDNVLQVAALLRRQADQMERALVKADRELRVEPLGADPVSRDAAESFRPKIRRILDLHWAHCEEVRSAVEALRRCAFDYGFTDTDLDASFRRLTGE